MGCCCSKYAFSKSVENNYIVPFELSLEFQLYNSKDIDNYFHRYALSGRLNYNQLFKALSEIGVNFIPFLKFFSKFDERNSPKLFDKSYSVKKLNCLGILYGISTNAEKIHLLFMNYDIEALNVLDQTSVEDMVSDILFVCLDAIPSYSLVLSANAESLQNYVEYIKSSSDAIFNILLETLLNDKLKITYQDFELKFKKTKAKYLLYPSLLRKWAYKLHLQLENILENAGNKDFNLSEKDRTSQILGLTSGKISKSRKYN